MPYDNDVIPGFANSVSKLDTSGHTGLSLNGIMQAAEGVSDQRYGQVTSK